ncbi:MAG TPA: acyl-CoA dehydrogenase family protein [Thermoanaerobaculia bacterium]|nr:acyl-CoA dehydrogenase family protein [Thermoanaerobaculia bacterium]
MQLAPPAHLAPRLDAYRRFVDEVLLPLEGRFLLEGFAAVEEALGGAREEARRRRLWAPHLPPDLGGQGLALVDFAWVSRVLGRTPLGHYACHCHAPDIGTMELLLAHGSPAQRERFLAPLAAGAVRSCFAMTEPDLPGSNPTWLATTARREGDQYQLDGRKWFASSADGAAFAVVMAVTDPDAAPHRRASLFLVPTDTPGFQLVENLSVMGHRGRGWASHGEVAFEGCRVPSDLRIGGEGDGFALAQERLGPGRIHHCMRWLGIADRALELLCRRAAERQLAPGRRLAEEGVVQQWVADSAVEIRAASLLVLDAAASLERDGPRGAREPISAIKVYAARVMLDVLDRAIQAHGALGVTDRTPLAWFWRHERAARIYDGPDEVHRRVVAREVLRPYLRDAPPPTRETE